MQSCLAGKNDMNIRLTACKDLKQLYTFEKTFAENLLTPDVIQDVHVILFSVEKK